MFDEKKEAFIHENNNLIIGAALSEITDEEKKFLYDKYYSKKTFVYLNIKMHVHINGLQRWRDKILDELSLCNAVLETNYKDESEIEINTLEGNFFNGQKNDVSCAIQDRFLVLVEHQSTVNPNMPFRFLSY